MNLRIPSFLAHSIAALALLSVLFPAVLPAQSFRAFDIQAKPEQSKEATRAVLEKISPGTFEEAEDTRGFHWRYRDRWSSPFDFEVMGGTVTARNNQGVLRVEGPSGDTRTLSRVLELEKVLSAGATERPRGEAVAIERKSHIASQSLNLVAPWIGTLYNSWGSPRLTRGQTWFRFFGYFFLDAFLVAAGGTQFFREPFDASANGGAIAAALALPRIMHAVSSANLIRGHNRLVEFSYTFYLE